RGTSHANAFGRVCQPALSIIPRGERRKNPEWASALANWGLCGGRFLCGRESDSGSAPSAGPFLPPPRLLNQKRTRVQPSLQYLGNPGGDRSVPNALVIGVNVVFTF